MLNLYYNGIVDSVHNRKGPSILSTILLSYSLVRGKRIVGRFRSSLNPCYIYTLELVRVAGSRKADSCSSFKSLEMDHENLHNAIILKFKLAIL